MLKKIVIVCGVLLLFMTACGSDKDSSAPADKDETTAPTAVATAKPTEEANAGGGAEDVFQPLSLLGGPLLGASGGGLDMQGGSQNVNPQLKAALLAAEDLPPGYNSIGGDIGYNMDLPQGPVSVAMRMFTEGDVMSGEQGSIVMSAVMDIPASAMSEFDASIAAVKNMDLTPEGIKKMMGDSGAQGIEFKEARLIDTPGLGEEGVGMHMVMDMSGLAGSMGEALGAYQAGLAYDVYMFKRGQRMMMVVVMGPAGEQPDVDGLALAEVMDGRAP